METEVGPLTSAKLREFASSGRLAPTDLIRKGECGKWVNASRVTGLFPANGSSASDPKNHTPVTSSIQATVTSANTASQQSRDASQPLPSLDGPSSYAMQNLMKGEKVVYAAQIHPWIMLVPGLLFGSFAIGMLIIMAGFLMLAAGFNSGTGIGSVIAMPLVLVGLPWPLFFPKALIAYYTTECVLTDKRVIAKTGLISLKSAELLLNQIEGLQVKQGVLGRMFNYGSIAAGGTGGSATIFPGIASPFEFRKAVQEEITRCG